MKRPSLDQVCDLAVRAGEEILRIYEGQSWSVTAKADESPVTEADLRANDMIVTGLTALSRDPVISEEGPHELDSPSHRFWLVDPLDGTRDFVAKLDTFVVCIALIESGEPVLGVIYAPVSRELYRAEKGKGTLGPDYQLLFNRSQRSGLIAAGSRSVPSERMKGFYDRYQVTHVERFGSALKFCKVAEGRYDLYPRFGPTMEWDTAAGQIIAEEAGCRVVDLKTGNRLRYGKPGFLNAGFICAREDLKIAEDMHRQLLKPGF